MEINEYLLKLFRMIKDMEGLDLFAATAKLSKTEFRLIREIIMEGEKGNSIISSELARRLGITRSAISQLVTKLEERDIVKRTASPTDRKIAYICLSERTLAVFEEQCKQANEFMELVVKEYGEKKMRAFMQSYDEFSAALHRVRERVSVKKTKE